MVASHIDGFVGKQIEPIESFLKVMFHGLKDARG
jgi:hypothetical protein